ncbi:transposase [Paenibacillus peoriae]|nr:MULTISPECIES: transposase [Paenibacillus]UMY57388.1 transposase [Paenibacillus peoriae]
MGVSTLHGDANPHYGTGKRATIYRFVSNQFSIFYTKVINTNTRDAVHVIDGLLHHETDLAIEPVHRLSLWFNEFAQISLTGKDSKAFDLLCNSYSL